MELFGTVERGYPHCQVMRLELGQLVEGMEYPQERD
jgi:hypothetical protein